MNNTGLYGKPIERWNKRTVQDRQQWLVFCQLMVAKYERMLRKGGGSTIEQEGYGAVFMASTSAGKEGNNVSLIKSVIQYAERTAASEAKMTVMESRLSQLETVPTK